MAHQIIHRRLLLTGALALTGCGVRHAKTDLASVTLRGATYRGNPDGFFKEAGTGAPPYRFTTAQFASGTLIAEAINARAIDIGGMSEIPPIFVADTPSNLVRIVAVLRGDVNNQVVLVPKGSSLSKIADLKGKRVGYVRATTSHYILLRLLDEVGLSWKDITPVSLSPQDGLAAFQRGALDAWVIYGVIVQQARAAGARVLTTALGRLSGNYVVAAAADALEDTGKRAAIRDYLQRYKKVLDWINADDNRYAGLLAATTGVPAAYYLQQFHERSARSSLEPVTDAAIASQQGVADAFFKAGVIPAKVDVKPLWDRSLATALPPGWNRLMTRPKLDRLADFIVAVSALLDEQPDPAQGPCDAKALLSKLLVVDDWLPDDYAKTDLANYQQYLLYCDPRARFSIVSFVWGPGQKTPIHNHTVWGVVGVLRGAEFSQSYQVCGGGVHPKGLVHRLSAGDVEVISPDPGELHQVSNALDDESSISIHLYGADIGSVRRLIYDEQGAATAFVSGYVDAPAPDLSVYGVVR